MKSHLSSNLMKRLVAPGICTLSLKKSKKKISLLIKNQIKGNYLFSDEYLSLTNFKGLRSGDDTSPIGTLAWRGFPYKPSLSSSLEFVREIKIPMKISWYSVLAFKNWNKLTSILQLFLYLWSDSLVSLASLTSPMHWTADKASGWTNCLLQHRMKLCTTWKWKKSGNKMKLNI